MEAAREQGVWNRVAAPAVGGQSREELRILLMNAGELTALFQGLMGKIPRGKEKLRQILELEQVNQACLKGMLVFSGENGQMGPRPLSPIPVRQALMRGYYLAKKGATEYTARSVDPEFGVVYQEMAGREIKICNLIVETMGISNHF